MKRDFPHDNSPSAYCLSLVNQLLKWLPFMSDDDIYAVLLRFREKHGASHKGVKWFADLIAKVRGEREARCSLSPVRKEPTVDIPDVMSLAELKARPELLTVPEAIIPNFLWAGNVTLLVGRDKGGKSTCARSLISRYSHSGGPVLWVRVEENTAHILQKFEDMEANLDNIFLFVKRNPSMKQIRKWVDEIQPTVIVVDTLSTWLSENGVNDENASSQIIPLITPFTDLAQETEAGLLLLYHKQKSGNEYRGSTAVGGNVDMILTMTPNGRNRTFKPVGRFEIPEFAMFYDGTHYQYVTDRTQDDWDESVYKLIEQNPGIGKNKLRKEMVGDHVRTDKSVENLIDQGRVENRKHGSRNHHYHTVLEAEKLQHTHPAHIEGETVLERKPNAAQDQHGSSTPNQHTQVPHRAGGSPLHGKGNQHSRPTFSIPGVGFDIGMDIDALKAQKFAEAMGVDELGTFGDSADLLDDEEDEREN